MKSENLYDLIDFQFAFSEEMIEDNGEDSYYSALNNNYSVLAVFDGCGGLGSKEYDNFNGKTGAYMASRIVSGATKKWFSLLPVNNEVNVYKQLIDKSFKIAAGYADKDSVIIKGSMQKPFPTTIALALNRIVDREIETEFIWAGDSRGYILDENGLHQITQDDINGEDAMSNLSDDGVLTNVVSLTGEYKLHNRKLVLKKPSVIFCATDGCFGYLSTPMEFENLLLETMNKSNSPDEWKNQLTESIRSYACDDYTMSLSAIGYKDFFKMKKLFVKRFHELQKEYIISLSEKSYEEKVELWNKYKDFYEKY